MRPHPGKTRLLGGTSRLVTVTLEITAPDLAPGEWLYLASNLNGWNARDDRYRVFPDLDGRLRRTLSMRRGELLEFKVSRGGWERVEVDTAGRDRPNRTFKADEDAVVEVAIAAWHDQFPQKIPHSTIGGDVRTLGPVLIPSLQREREVLVYLPPDYDTPEAEGRRYPVLYMFDGQNLFDAATAFSGEWGIDKAMDRLILAGELAPVIVVAIYNGQEHRIAEQCPWALPRLGVPHPQGDLFLGWVADTIKPLIDAKFRTLPDRDHTGIGGSSMGGLTALYAAFRHPRVFGRILSMSPALWVGDRAIFPYVKGRHRPPGTKIYLDCGHLEGVQRATRAFARTAGDMAAVLESLGFRMGEDLRWVDDPTGSHDEASWGRRFPEALKFLWPSP